MSGACRGGSVIAFLILLVFFAAWALWAGRGWPPRKLIACYLLTDEIGSVAEFFFGSALGLYSLNTGFIADHQVDHRLAELIVRHALNPTLTVLYVLYKRRSPVGVAVAGGVGLGLMELLLLWVGAVDHRGWNVFYTAIFYTVYFLMIHFVTPYLWRAPAWLITGLFAFAVCNASSVALHGVIGLYHHRLPGMSPEIGDKLLTLVRNILITGPAIAFLSAKRRPSPLFQTLVLAFLILVEGIGLGLGWIVYKNWHIGFAALRFATVVFLSMHFVAWWREAPVDAVGRR